MSERHESCFLCQRAKPNKHVYYRDYAELEGVHYSMVSQRLVQRTVLLVTTAQNGICIPGKLLTSASNHTDIPDWQLQCRRCMLMTRIEYTLGAEIQQPAFDMLFIVASHVFDPTMQDFSLPQQCTVTQEHGRHLLKRRDKGCCEVSSVLRLNECAYEFTCVCTTECAHLVLQTVLYEACC